jgi:eukaryotic-like serine/threonine-protein kinase
MEHAPGDEHSAPGDGGDGEAPRVPGYLLLERLGRGGSGEVWRAVPRGRGGPVAVKLLVEGDPERQAREAALLGALDHPHLVRLHEVVHQPRRGGSARVTLVLDLLAGGSLADLLARRGRLRPGEVVTALAPVAAALAHAHAEGVVHGDLSPGNVVFTAEGRPVLTDLGVARILGEAAATEVTPAYVDPTVARGGATGPASDVFGVAAAAFHALTGVPPWNGAGPADRLAVAAAGELPDLDALAPDAPAELRAVIARGLAREPHARGSAAAFALDLRHACRPEPVRLARPDPSAPAPVGRATELTHQVPGRSPRPAPVVVDDSAVPRGLWRVVEAARLPARYRRPGGEPGRHRDGDRPRSVRRPVALVGTALVLLGVVGVGVRWGSEPDPGPAVTAVSAVADRTDRASSGGQRGTAPGSSTAPSSGTALPSESPTADAARSPDEWRAVLTELYGRRAAAFSGADGDRLASVYVAGSPLGDADRANVADLGRAGQALRGFAPEVVRVESVDVRDDEVVLRVVDRWPSYEVVARSDPSGPALRTVGGRPEADVRLVLVRGAGGWRIASAERLG